MESLANNTEGFNGAEIEECIKRSDVLMLMLKNPENPQLKTTHLMNAILKNSAVVYHDERANCCA